MVSVDFAKIEALQHAGDWDETAEILSREAQSVEAAGADFLLICTNTMHKVAPKIQQAIQIPLLHIADATATRLAEAGIRRVGLLGTRFTMEQDFYRGRLQDEFGIEVLIPDVQEREQVHHIIYQELCRGEVRESSRAQYLTIIDGLRERGAQAVILGCTEIALLVQQQHTSVPLYDTTQIHAASAVRLALS